MKDVRNNGVRHMKNIYPPEEAAEFLEITMEELNELTKRGDITLRNNKDKCFYLGGELDCAKCSVH